MSEDRPGRPATETHGHAMAEGDRSLSATGSEAMRLPAVRRPIVVVDDNPGSVTRIARILAEAGHPTITATGGRSALRQVFGTSVEPILLICAIEMSEMPGIELAARLAAARPGVRVLLMSVDPRSVERAQKHLPLVHGVLQKPFSPDELREAVAAALAHDP